MSSAKAFSCVSVVILFLTSGACGEDSGKNKPEVVFQSVMSSIKITPLFRADEYSALKPSAKALAKEIGKDGIFFLENEIFSPSSTQRRKLAALTLAELSDCPDGFEAVVRVVLGKVAFEASMEMILALGYIPVENIRIVAMKILSRIKGEEGKSPHIFESFVRLLSATGDIVALKYLQQIKKECKARIANDIVNTHIVVLERKVGLDVKRKAAWEIDGLEYWRAMQEGGGSRGGSHLEGMDIAQAALRLRQKKHKISIEFVREKMKIGDSLAIALIGTQNMSEAIDDLKPFVSMGGGKGKLARGALARIGNSRACRILENYLAPANSSLSSDIVVILQECGDRKSFELLTKLRNDNRYSNRIRSLFKHAAECIQIRLNREKK